MKIDKYLQIDKDNNSKGNNNNEVNKSDSRGASSHRLEYRQRESKITRKPFLSSILVLSLAQSWSLCNLESRCFHQHVQTCTKWRLIASLEAGQMHARQSTCGTPHQGSETQCSGFVSIVLTDPTKTQKPASCFTT